MAEPRRHGRKLRHVFPDWAAGTPRKPDLNLRVVTFNPRAFELRSGDDVAVPLDREPQAQMCERTFGASEGH